MRIAMIGTGYVGLVTGACFASLGNDVICMDIDAAKIVGLKVGKLPIYEPGLEDLVKTTAAKGKLQFTTNLAEAVGQAGVVFLALPTPPGQDGSADLSYVLGVAEQLGPLLKSYTVVVDKSTVPVGTSEEVRSRIAAKAKSQFDVVSNPEFLREGFALNDFLNPDRIVIGASSEKARKLMAKLYKPLVKNKTQLIHMNERSAELTKYAANSFLAMKITFTNEIANICELVGADVDQVRAGIGSDDRIGPRFLYAGIGYGGSCFPKDAQALHRTAAEHGYNFSLLDTVIGLNTLQQQRLQAKLLKYFNQNIKGKTFALWGLAFKAGTDDTRQAPAMGIIRDLTAKGAQVVAYDPEAMDRARSDLAGVKGVSFADDKYAAVEGADALLIATEWEQFKEADLKKIKKLLAKPVIFDGRNVFDTDVMQGHGFYYESIGRPVVATNAAAGSRKV